MHYSIGRRQYRFKGFSLIKLAALFVLLTQSALAQEKSCVEQLKDLRLELLAGKVPTHFSPGQRKRASELKGLLEEAGAFYERSLGLTPVVTLAALAPNEWPLLLDKPYGLPTLRTGPCKRGGGNPNLPKQFLAIVPVTFGGPIYDDWIALKGSLSPKTMKKLKKSGIAFEEGGKVMLDFVALHELGHAYAHAMGIDNVSSFFAEFTGNYLAYAFLRSTKERFDKRTMAVLTANLEGITPIHASLDKFEKFQSREHPPTEAWYNSAFTVKAAEVYDAKGFAFLKEVRDAFAGEKYLSITNEEILRRLEKIHPGFEKWAQQLPRLPEKTKTQYANPKNSRSGETEQEIIQLANRWNEAFLKNDAATLRTVMAEDIIIIYGDGSRATREEEIASIGKNEQIESSIPDEIQVRVYGDTAVMMSRLTVTGVRQGKKFNAQFRFLDVYRKRDGRWQCVITQNTRIGKLELSALLN